MNLVIILFGVFYLLAGIVILINQEIIFGFVLKNIDNPILQIISVLIRFVLGALLILESDISRFPIIIEVIGWTSIISALILSIIGRRYYNSLMTWLLSLSKVFKRIGGIFSITLGMFLIYSFV